MQRTRYWYRLGTLMRQYGLSGEDVKMAMEQDGNIVHWSPEYIRRMRISATTVSESEISGEDAAQCEFRVANEILRHFRSGAISPAETQMLFRRKSRHVGKGGRILLTNVRSKSAIRNLIDQLSHTSQDDH